MKVALIQLDVAWESKDTNLQNAGRLVREASEAGCDIAVLPEMFSTGFSMNVSDIVEEEHGPTASFLSGLAREHLINIIGGFASRGSGAKGRNIAHAYGRDGALLASYAKMHPFSFADEDKHYEAGHDTVVFELDGMPSSVFICYDLRFPETVRTVARRVRSVFFIANWPAERIGHWETLLQARAIENQCFVIGLNRTGTDANGLGYPGGSRIFGPEGEDVCPGGGTGELIICEFDPAVVERVRSEHPFLEDMRL